jgi:hypothetical protein
MCRISLAAYIPSSLFEIPKLSTTISGLFTIIGMIVLLENIHFGRSKN